MEHSKFLILGGLGFIGRHIALALLSRGYKVRILDRSPVDLQDVLPIFANSKNLEYVAGNFGNSESISNALNGCDCCIHLVTTTLPATSNTDKVFDVQSNLIGTIQLLEAMRNQGLKKLIFLSSGGTVYGNPVYTPIDEDHPTNPLSSYGIVKLAIEKYCRLYNHLHETKAIALRLSNPYGPGQSGNGIQGAVSAFLTKALTGQPIEIWGDGSVVRDYIHIDDVTNAILSAISYDGNEAVFNVGSGTGTSLNEIVDCLRKSFNPKLTVNYKASRSLDVSTNILDISRARRELGWSPNIEFESGIQALISDFKRPCCMDKR